MSKVISLAILMMLSAVGASNVRAADPQRGDAAAEVSSDSGTDTDAATCPTLCHITSPSCCPGETCVRMSLAYGLCR